MSVAWTYWAADYYAALEWVAAGVAIIIILSAIDDMAVDAWYWLIRLQRVIRRRKHPYQPLTSAQLLAREEQAIAIMVPAWMEYDVIAAMIENMASVLNYKNYVIFVGTYVNDPPTIQEVERMRRRYKHLRRVEVPNPGPTCKADCLNWIVQAIFLHETTTGTTFAGVILHDSEDVLHPLELKFFNYLLPRKDLIQLPVLSLERKWYELVAGTYMDEFAESHGKDMTVREASCGVVPSAGVGTCFSRKALMSLCEETQNQPFNTRSLTEDYDIGNRLAQMGMQSIFATFPVQFVVKRESWLGLQSTEAQTITMPLCVREYFPDTFRTAYRQKARWALGIGLQSWDQLSFRGSLAARYFMLRDRKGIVTSLISIVAYVLLFQFLLFQLAAYMGWWTRYYPPRFTTDGWWLYALVFNFFALANRVGHRAYFVTVYYGWRHGLMSAPRMIVSNFVNFMAVARAWKLYLSYLFVGQTMVWDKTMHDFPSAESLVVQKQRIGDLLQSWQAIDADMLHEALQDQLESQRPLGRILVAKGWLDDETLAEAIAFQWDLPRVDLIHQQYLAHIDALGVSACAQFRAIPLGLSENGLYKIAVASPMTDADLQDISKRLGAKVEIHIALEREITQVLLELAPPDSAHVVVQDIEDVVAATPRLGDILIENGWVDPAVLMQAIEAFDAKPKGRLGDFLVKQGVLARPIITKAVRMQTKLKRAAEAKQSELAMEVSL